MVDEKAQDENVLMSQMSKNLSNLRDGLDKVAHMNCVKTLHKVIENIAVNPDEPKFKQLPPTNKGVKEKILAHEDAVQFMTAAGF